MAIQVLDAAAGNFDTLQWKVSGIDSLLSFCFLTVRRQDFPFSLIIDPANAEEVKLEVSEVIRNLKGRRDDPSELWVFLLQGSGSANLAEK